MRRERARGGRQGVQMLGAFIVAVVVSIVLSALLIAQASAQPAHLGKASSSPKSLLTKFYAGISHWNFGNAYNLIDPHGRPSSVRNWVENVAGTLGGYLTTTSVSIRSLTDSGSRIHTRTGRYACIGIAFTAGHTDGQTTAYGGWYMARYTPTKHWRILLPGSNIAVASKALVPSRARCTAAIPKALR